MAGLYSPLAGQGSAEIESLGVDAIPSTSGQVLGAAFDEGLAHNLTPRLMRSQGRFTAETGLLGVDEFGRPIMGEPEALLDTETANRDYGIKDVLTFDKPVPQSVAKDLHDSKFAQLEREDIIRRRETGLLTGGAARFTASLGAGLLDPLNIALGFIPVVGQTREALWIAQAVERAGAAGAFAVRAGTGFAGGAAGMAALQPIEWGLSRQEHEDFTAADAIRNIAIGGLFGGGLHAGVGAIVDRVTGRYANPISQRIEEAGPEARAALLQGSVAQHLDGQPTNVASALDGIQAGNAERELLQWIGVQQRIDQQAETALRDVSASETRIAARRDVLQERGETRLTDLKRQADELRVEHARVLQEADAAVDTATTQRLTQISDELSKPIPSARRVELEAEQRMLQEGARTNPASDALERERSLAQAEGLARELGRVERRSVALEQQLTRQQAELSAGETASNRAFSIDAARLDAQQGTLQFLAERTIRRLARQAGVGMTDEEISATAYRLLRASPEEAKQEVATILGKRSGFTPDDPKDLRAAVQPHLQSLREQQNQAAHETAHPPREPASPIRAEADQAAKVPAPEKLEDVQQHVTDLEAQLGKRPPGEPPEAGAPGRPAPEGPPAAEVAAMEQADRLLQAGEARAAALEHAASVCLMRGA